MGQYMSGLAGMQTTEDQVAALKKTLKSADYLASRGLDGLDALQKLAETNTVKGDDGTEVTLPEGWQKQMRAARAERYFLRSREFFCQ